jgi:hypothetical protein
MGQAKRLTQKAKSRHAVFVKGREWILMLLSWKRKADAPSD